MNQEVKLYLMIPKETPRGHRTTLLACDGISAFRGVLPTQQILETHFQTERVRMEIYRRDNAGKKDVPQYVPQPLYLEIRPEIFEAIVEEAARKDAGAGTLNALALTLGGNFPCCIIGRLNPDEYEAKEEVIENGD